MDCLRCAVVFCILALDEDDTFRDGKILRTTYFLLFSIVAIAPTTIIILVLLEYLLRGIVVARALWAAGGLKGSSRLAPNSRLGFLSCIEISTPSLRSPTFIVFCLFVRFCWPDGSFCNGRRQHSNSSFVGVRTAEVESVERLVSPSKPPTTSERSPWVFWPPVVFVPTRYSFYSGSSNSSINSITGQHYRYCVWMCVSSHLSTLIYYIG